MTPERIEQIIPATNDNRPGYPMVPKYITIHETANTSPGANSLMHYTFLLNGGGPEGVSFHWCVDDKVARHFVPDNENAWHAGDGFNGVGNRSSLAIETCVNADGDWQSTLRNLAELVAFLCGQHHIPIENVVEHNHWSGKDCPHIMRIPPPYFAVEIANISQIIQGAIQPDNMKINVPGFGEKWIVNEMYKRYSERVDALVVWGLPLTGMYEANNTEVQVFERAIFRHKKGTWPQKFDVLLDLIGHSSASLRGYLDPQGNPVHDAFKHEQGKGQDNSTYKFFTQTGHSVQHGFLAYWEKHGGLDVFGYPISMEFTEMNSDFGQKFTVQYFERARMEWHPGQNPADFDVMLGRLGAEMLERGMAPRG